MSLCACGCGGTTTVAKRAERGLQKGDSARFVTGHNLKTQPRVRPRPGVHYAQRHIDGVLRAVHRIRAELALGKPLPLKAIVHHADGSRDDNAPLVICQGEKYHRLLHARMRIKAAGGNPNTDAVCAVCRSVKSRSQFYPRRQGALGVDSSCRDCNLRRQAASKQGAQAAALQPAPAEGAGA